MGSEVQISVVSGWFIQNKLKAKEFYDLLIQTYEKTGPIHLLILKRRLWDLKYKSSSRLADLFKEHEELIRSIMEDFGMLILSQVKNMIMINEESDALQCEMDMDSCSKDKEAVMVLFIVNNKFKRMKLYDVHFFQIFTVI